MFLLQPLNAHAITIKNTKSIVELPYSKADQVSEIVLTPTSVILVGTTESNNSNWINGPLGGLSDAFIVSYSATGAPLWNLRLGGTENEIANSVTIDTDGSIWVVGASTSITTTTPAPLTGQVLNPDNVIPEVTKPKNSPLNRIKIWQISTTGNLLNTFETISDSVINPRKILLSDKNVIVFGNSYSKTTTTGFFLNMSKSGIFLPLVKLGMQSTQISSAVINSDSSFTAVGMSSDSLLKTKALSKQDAVTLKISLTGAIQAVGRATLKNTSRDWNSIGTGLLQGGKVSYLNKMEAAITKFSAISKPVWNSRYAAKSTALVSSGSTSWATFISSGQIKGVSSWNPKTPTPILIEFGKKGEVLSSYKLSSPAVAIATNKELGTVLITDTGVSFGLVMIN